MSSKVSWPGASADRTARPASWSLPKKDKAVQPAFPASSAEPVAPASPVAAPRPVDHRDEPPMAGPPPPTPQKQPAPAQPNPLELELRRRIALLGKALEELEVTLERERHNMAEEAIDLGLAVAEELAAGAIALEPSRIVTIVREAVELLADEREVKLRLHPNIIEELDRMGALDGFKENPRFKLRSDPTVGEAGCIVETKAGRVDARVRARLSKLRYLLSQGEGYEEGES